MTHRPLQPSPTGARALRPTNIAIDAVSATVRPSTKSHQPNRLIQTLNLSSSHACSSFSIPQSSLASRRFHPQHHILNYSRLRCETYQSRHIFHYLHCRESRADSPAEFATCLLPTFTRLVESEMHILLQDPSPDSLEWGQHMAQLSALVHSRFCPGGLDHVPIIAAPKFHEFIKWVQLSRKGKRDYNALQRLQEDYKQHETPVKSVTSRHPTLHVPLTIQKRINLICSIM